MRNLNRRDQIDSHSVASMSSKPSTDQASADRVTQRSNSLGQRKPPPWYSLRRIINDIQRQRFGGPTVSKKSRAATSQPRSVIVDVEGPSVVSRASQNNPKLHPMDATKSFSPVPIENSSIYTADSIIECSLCTLSHFYADFFTISACKHLVCHSCMNVYLTIEIAESRINIACPICPEKLHPNEIKEMLEDETSFSKYEQFMVRRVLANESDSRWCPAPDCSYAVIATGCASCPKITCERPGCGTTFCYHCKQIWHPNQTCDSAKAERLSNLRSSSFSFSQESSNAGEIKPCPRCQAFIIKMNDGSCNHMTCAICGAEFCWLCMKEISDLHYLSPSGCTFWGKKPWSRKKKILWQLGTLIGAPVGIVLIAGISVPAIIIGLPIWVGKKIHGRCSHMTVHKRNLAIAGGVISSILISPLLAALVVGIGVPILLAYVYGVVPISLCRSGGCGVKTTNTGKVKIDFDEAYAPAVSGSGPFQDKSADNRSGVMSMGHHVTNPSIGPSIGEMSLATNSLSASGSHIDRIGISPGGILGPGVTGPRDDSCDRDSASHLAMAGSCGVGQNMESISYASGGTAAVSCGKKKKVPTATLR